MVTTISECKHTPILNFQNNIIMNYIKSGHLDQVNEMYVLVCKTTDLIPRLASMSLF